MKPRIIVAVGLCALIGELVLPCALAQDAKGEEVVKQVLAAWEKRRKAMKSISYVLEERITFVRGSLTDPDPKAHRSLRNDFPPSDTTIRFTTTLDMVFAIPQLRKATKGMILDTSLGKFVPHEVIDLVDGNKAFQHFPREGNSGPEYTPKPSDPVAAIYSEVTSGVFLAGDNYPVLFAAGVPPINGLIENESKHFREPSTARTFTHIGRVAAAGKMCDVLRTQHSSETMKRDEEYVVDVAADAAIVRWTHRRNDVAHRVYDVTWKQQEGHWLPATWVLHRFRVQDKARKLTDTTTTSVVSISINPAFNNSHFRPQLNEGDVAEQADSGNRLVVAPDGSLRPLKPRPSGFVFGPLHFSAAVIALIVGAVLWRVVRVPDPSQSK